MEYTISAIAGVIVVVTVDYLLKTRVTTQGKFWVFIVVMFLFKILVNGYLTARPIVLYGEEFFLGVRFFTIPVEDFFFGFSLITLSVVLWEYFARRLESREKQLE
jgi:lycopene cyclase domain-containing protein